MKAVLSWFCVCLQSEIYNLTHVIFNKVIVKPTQSFRSRKRHSFPASSLIWRRRYISRGSFPGDPATKVQKQSNPPIPGLKLPTKVNKFRPMPAYIRGVTPKGWPLKGALLLPKRSQVTPLLFVKILF